MALLRSALYLKLNSSFWFPLNVTGTTETSATVQEMTDMLVWKGHPDEDLKKAVLPDCFEVDLVRVFDEEK